MGVDAVDEEVKAPLAHVGRSLIDKERGRVEQRAAVGAEQVGILTRQERVQNGAIRLVCLFLHPSLHCSQTGVKAVGRNTFLAGLPTDVGFQHLRSVFLGLGLLPDLVGQSNHGLRQTLLACFFELLPEVVVRLRVEGWKSHQHEQHNGANSSDCLHILLSICRFHYAESKVRFFLYNKIRE